MNLRLGLIGLGNMGSAIALKFLKAYGRLTVYDISNEIKKKYNTKEYKDQGLSFANNLEELCKNDVIWLMVPANAVDPVLSELCKFIKKKLVIIDGGNSYFEDTKRRSGELKKLCIDFLDCGTSGGLWGAQNGFSLMVGGDKDVYEKVKDIFKHIAFNESAYLYVGPSGAGHYVKMVHNGIEYAVLESYAEGFSLLKQNSNYSDLDLSKICNTWLEGSVIRSWVLQLICKILQRDQTFEDVSGFVDLGGTGQWAVQEAEKDKIRLSLIKEAVQIRLNSHVSGGDYATKLVALTRHEMGGHPVYGTCDICQKI